MGDGTSIGRVRGLGSAHAGEHHWTLQRITALGNLLLGSWLAVSFALLPDFEYATVADWISGTVPSLAMVLLVISAFWHARLGLQVLIEDYVHDAGGKYALLALLNLAAFAGTAAGVFFILRIVMYRVAGEMAAGMFGQMMAAAGAR